MVDQVFSGDIGGTKIRLALWRVHDGKPTMVDDWTMASADVSCLDDALEVVARERDLGGLYACFGVAGPVVRGKARLTNLPWVVDPERLTGKFGFGRTSVINDVEATAWAVPSLDPSKIHGIKAGSRDPQGAVAVVAVGTGLGQAGLIWVDGSPAAISGEGGHADFAINKPVENDLRRFLSLRYGHVSWERVLSGDGLVDLAEFFFEREGLSIGEWFETQDGCDGLAAAITSAAQTGRSEACAYALDLFSEILGSQAGNFALTLAATGGVFLAGGIPPKILPTILEGGFSKRFVDKGRMRRMLEEVPVSVILDQDAPLLGAAQRAARALENQTLTFAGDATDVHSVSVE